MGWKVWGSKPCEAKFSASDQSSPEACPACAVGTRSPSQGVVKWPGRGIDHPSPSSDDDDDVNVYSCSCSLPLCLHGILWGCLYLDVCEY